MLSSFQGLPTAIRAPVVIVSDSCDTSHRDLCKQRRGTSGCCRHYFSLSAAFHELAHHVFESSEKEGQHDRGTNSGGGIGNAG